MLAELPGALVEQHGEEQRKLTAEQIGVLKLQRSELEASTAQREREAGERRSAQAAMVTSWFGSRQVKMTEYTGSQAVVRPGATLWGAFIRNASHLPVFQVRVFFRYVQEEPSGSWSTSMRGGPVGRIRVIPPGDDRFVEIPDQVRKMIDQCDDQVYMTSIEFTDAFGVRWERDPRGALVRE